MNGMSLHGYTVPVYQAAHRYIVPGYWHTGILYQCTRQHTGSVYQTDTALYQAAHRYTVHQAAYTQVHERH